MIYINAVSDLTGAVQVSRQGFIKPPFVIIRSALENLAAAVVMHNDEKQFKLYQSSKLNLPWCIGQAKKFFSEFGPIYGSFTNNFVHEKLEQIYGRRPKPKIRTFNTLRV